MSIQNVSKQDFISNLAKSRNHQIVSGNYKHCKSEFKFKCLLHNQTYTTTYNNYKRSKYGLSCCSSLKGQKRPKCVKQKIAKALKGQTKKSISWLKNLKGNRHPAYKHGHGNSRAQTQEELLKLKEWKKSVLRAYNYQCFVTGKKKTSNDPLVIHHLDSWDSYENRRYDIHNGVVILKSIHSTFHNLYGFGKNTALQFETFLYKNYNIQSFPWKYGNHEPSLCIKSDKMTHQTFCEKKEIEFNHLFQSRKHTKLSGKYLKYDSPLLLFCTIHQKTTQTTYFNYKKSKWGCLCCAREKQSKAVSKANRLRSAF
uniref:Putative H-N-H homing endonuclease n=1 Tax=Gloeotilopsis planctonica TaxID=34157 RepID=A0A1B2RZ98_9CHLO|nr:putative H-N-H homing endonuclease [Gloeotilopsis planctonica]